MNEITQVNLGRQAFTIAIDAQKLLRDYLNAVKKHSGGSEEVVEEVENRMAELLIERGVSGSKVVLVKDVEYLRTQLGEPGDFDDDSEDAASVEDDSSVRKLFRDTDNAMIAGVAAGLANYLSVDTVIVRLIFIALTFFGGSGILLYIILWLLVPEAKTNSQRLQMRGLAVNVDNIKEALAGADVSGATRRVSSVVGKVITSIAGVTLRITGLLFVIVGVTMVIGGAVLTIYGLVRGAGVAGIPIFPVGKEEVMVLVCGFIILALISSLLAMTGIALVRRKLSVPGWAIAAVIGVFIVAASVGVGLGFDVAPSIKARYDGLHHTRAYSVQPISRVHILGNNASYVIARGDTPQVRVNTLGGTDAQAIKVTEQNGVLTIDTADFRAPTNCSFVCPYGAMAAEIVVYAPNLDAITVDAPRDTALGLSNNGVGYEITDAAGGATSVATPVPPTPPIPASEPR